MEHVTLIDFGLTSKYKGKDKKHISDTETTDVFQGNTFFSSLDSMNFYRTSRKDDMVSLYLMMVWLMNDNEFVGEPADIDPIKVVHTQKCQDVDKELSVIRAYKTKYHLVTLAQHIFDKNELLGLDDKIKT